MHKTESDPASKNIDIQSTVKRAEDRLNSALSELEKASSSLQRQILEMQLQTCIFQYDICAEMASLIRNAPAGFAASVALKGLVLRLFEYDLVLNRHIVPRLLALAEDQQISVDRENVELAGDRWKGALRQIEQWAEAWNKAAGESDPDIRTQVKLLKELNIGRVMNVTEAFIGFNLRLLKTLGEAGKGIPAE